MMLAKMSGALIGAGPEGRATLSARAPPSYAKLRETSQDLVKNLHDVVHLPGLFISTTQQKQELPLSYQGQ